MCLIHGLPAADSSGCVCSLCPAAVVCPGPPVVVPGQTQAALHCERVAHLSAQVLVSGGFLKISIQHGQVSHPCRTETESFKTRKYCQTTVTSEDCLGDIESCQMVTETHNFRCDRNLFSILSFPVTKTQKIRF